MEKKKENRTINTIPSECSELRPIEQLLYIFIKRTIDIFVSLVGLIIFLPIFLAIWIMMKAKEPSAPVFFGHIRNGKNGKPFKVWKFRSMHMNAEKMLLSDSLLYKKFKENGYKLNEGEDPRITKLGLLLRKTSLDELPQLWNVLTGTMSLVGPRPIPDTELEEYGQAKARFLSVKPGITGLWQVSGRSKIRYPQRCELELRYIEEANLLLDIEILIRTIVLVLKQEGAY